MPIDFLFTLPRGTLIDTPPYETDAEIDPVFDFCEIQKPVSIEVYMSDN